MLGSQPCLLLKFAGSGGLIPGPDIRRFRIPEVRRIASRILSAGSLFWGKCQYNRFSGSRFSAYWEEIVSPVARLDCRYTEEVTISRCRVLMLQLLWINSVASQSRSSGCNGAGVCVPKSFAFETSHCPKWPCQIRLTITRAVRGFDRWVSHRASAVRRPDVLDLGD